MAGPSEFEKVFSACCSSPGHSFFLGVARKCYVQSVSAYLITQQEDGPKYVLSESGTDCLCTVPSSPDLTIPEFYPVRMERGFTIISNGAQTDSIKADLSQGKSPFDALHFSPLLPSHPSSLYLSAIRYRYGDSLLSVYRNSQVEEFVRRTYYECPWSPWSYLFSTGQEGGPVQFYLPGVSTSKLLAEQIWEILDPDTRVALFVRYIDQRNGFPETTIINRYGASSYSAPKTPIWPTRRNRK